MRLDPLIGKWGAGASSDRLRRSAICSKCGHRGATLQHPSWIKSLVDTWADTIRQSDTAEVAPTPEAIKVWPKDLAPAQM
jgi:hypothetical protein